MRQQLITPVAAIAVSIMALMPLLADIDGHRCKQHYPSLGNQ